MIEAQLRGKSNIIASTISESKILQTILFMTCSSIILHILKNNKKNVLWFLQPTKNLHEEKSIAEKSDLNLQNTKINENNDTIKGSSKCSHNENCIKFLGQGIKSYFLIGFALELVKSFFAKPIRKSHNFYQYIFNKLGNFNSNMIKFLVTYVGLYRVVINFYCIHRILQCFLFLGF